MTIVPTHDCNLACPYCYQTHEDKTMSQDIYANLIKYITKNAPKYRAIEINWFGGEPLLDVERIISFTKEIQRIAKRYHCALIQRMTTNGYLLDYEVFSSLVRLGILYYQITVDGPKDIHNKLRPHSNGDSFDVIIKNLKDIALKSSSNLFHISLRTNLTNLGSDKINSLINNYAQIFGGDKRFGVDLNMADDWGGESAKEVSFMHYQDYVAKSKEVINYINSIGLQTQESLKSVGDMVCDAQKDHCFIVDYDGSIHKCTVAMFIDEYRDISTVGQLNSNGDMEIDDTKHIQWLFNNKEQSACRECSILPFCMGKPCVYAVNIRGLNQCSLHSRNNPIDKVISSIRKYKQIG